MIEHVLNLISIFRPPAQTIGDVIEIVNSIPVGEPAPLVVVVDDKTSERGMESGYESIA